MVPTCRSTLVSKFYWGPDNDGRTKKDSETVLEDNGIPPRVSDVVQKTSEKLLVETWVESSQQG